MPVESPAVSEAEPTRVPVLKTVLVAVLLVALVVALRFLPVGPWIESFQAWVKDMGPAGYLVYIAVYVLACVTFVPASPLTIGAGAIFGFVEGTVVVIIGATLGATASFLLGRTVLRRRVEAMAANNARFRALDLAIAREGGRIVFLVRLAPVFPFTYINFAFGLTGVRTLSYVVATFFGIIPATVAFVYIADAATHTATDEMDTTRLIVNIVGIAIAIAVTAFVTRIALRAVRRAGID